MSPEPTDALTHSRALAIGRANCKTWESWSEYDDYNTESLFKIAFSRGAMYVLESNYLTPAQMTAYLHDAAHKGKQCKAGVTCHKLSFVITLVPAVMELLAEGREAAAGSGRAEEEPEGTSQGWLKNVGRSGPP